MNVNQKQLKRNSFTVMLIMTLFFIVVIAVIGIAVFRFYIKGFQETVDKVWYDRYFVMISENQKSSLWKSLYQGAYEEGIKENIYVDFLGENFPRDYTREELMQIAIDSGVDGIIVEADESEQMSELIDKAVQEGIPVVTLYGDNTHSKRCSFVGVGSYNLGREYGRQVLKIAGEIRGEAEDYGDSAQAENGDGGGEAAGEKKIQVVVLVNAYTQDSGQNILWSGIQETIENEKEQETEIEMTLVSVDDTNAFSVEESIRDIFMEEELPDIIICLNELNTICVYQAVVDYNKVGQVNILGHYDSETIINGIDRNVIYATVSVDALQMGKFSINALTEYYELGNTSQYFTADIALIDKENVSLYMKGEGEDDE